MTENPCHIDKVRRRKYQSCDDHHVVFTVACDPSLMRCSASIQPGITYPLYAGIASVQAGILNPLEIFFSFQYTFFINLIDTVMKTSLQLDRVTAGQAVF